MFGREVELDALQDTPCFSRLKSLVEARCCVSIEIILHDAKIFGLRGDRIDQPANTGVARHHRLWEPDVSLGCDKFLVEADSRIGGIVILFIPIQHVFHRCDKLRSYVGNTPVLVLPGFEVIFLSSWRMVSFEPVEMEVMHKSRNIGSC